MIKRKNNALRLLAMAALFNCTGILWGQAPVNDNCADAINIADPTSFCSAAGEGTTLQSTPSGVPATPCATYLKDVWFRFTAVAEDVVFKTLGKNNGNAALSGGSVPETTVAIYSGSCNNLTLLQCQRGSNYYGITNLILHQLVPGQEYFIRVLAGATGTFQYCIENKKLNYSPDCPTAPKICSKDPIDVPLLYGAGADVKELDDASCFGAPFGIESASAWLTFEAANDGNLEFLITPHDSVDDIDFVLYRLPNGLGNCAEKEVVRCMASGELFYPSPCMGPTGLVDTATDVYSEAGCFGNSDAFLSPLKLEPGAVYALGINNYTAGTNTQTAEPNGFTITWGGTAVFSNMPTFPADTTINQGQSVTLAVGNAGMATWVSPADTLLGVSVTISPEEDITYLVTAGDGACTSTDTVHIKVIQQTFFNMPNAFTPNGDNANDTFGPVTKGYTPVRLQIWSRWGNKVFDSGNAAIAWDGQIEGTPAPMDVYFYQIVAEDPTGNVIQRKGELSLLR